MHPTASRVTDRQGKGLSRSRRLMRAVGLQSKGPENFGAFSFLFQIPHHNLRKPIKVPQMPLENSKNRCIVYPCIVMDDEIAETGHIQEIRQKIVGHNLFLVQDREHIPIALRGTKSLCGNEALPNIYTCLDGNLKRALDRPADQLVIQVRLKINVLKFQ